MIDGTTSFRELTPVFEKMWQVYQYGNEDKAALGYNDGNQGFAQGKGAMYWHGTYAIPAIRSYNPDINLGTFATPADDAADTKLVSTWLSPWGRIQPTRTSACASLTTS